MYTIQTLDTMITRSKFRGYDPYDILNSSPLLSLARRSRWTGVALTQAFRLLPINLRPLLGVQPVENAKTMAVLARAYTKLHAHTQEHRYRDQAMFCLDWLDTHRSSEFQHACWGYSFPWCTVRQFLECDAPSIVCTAFVSHAFLDAYERWGDPHHLAIARSTCDFILQDCLRIEKEDTFCFSYTPYHPLPVHNANLLGVSVLGRVYRHTGENELLKAALSALAYTLNDQNADGSWYYHGPYPGRDGTIDNFHTGFNLECLRRFAADTGYDLQNAIDRGQAFYEGMFAADGAPRRKVGAPYPVDIRDAAEFLVVMSGLPAPTEGQTRLVEVVLAWTFRHMQHRSGYFHYVRWRHFGRSPMYLRWQAWMLWGLVNMLGEYAGRTSR